ncbi:SUN domain-containing protein 2-like [Pectinophora gossypiella]|uniref:SUN domain-containing protein 2-like n=1 Tax=Pectinophora gossypiella TaxID=13191 RepID=UPI00214ECA1B|nr:SUN domain-containing protein 2-like [Pectinophora gossypiella]
MEYETGGCLRGLFRCFVCVSLATLLGLHVYGYFWGPASDGFDGDFSDIKYVVMQLTRGLSEVNRKHENLKTEMDRISSALPSVAAAAGRARESLQSTCCRNTKSIDVHDFDRQVTDFALESAGARIIDTGDTVEHILYESPVGYALHVLASWLCRGHECLNARVMLRPGSLPGECWAFRGATGEATIRLLGTVQVTGVSLEHIPAHISPTKDISSAPRVFTVEGLECRGEPFPHDFGTFEYIKDGRPIQYFSVTNPVAKGFNMIRLRIISNWGHPVYTCVYRFRVHGELLPGQTPIEDDMRIDNE